MIRIINGAPIPYSEKSLRIDERPNRFPAGPLPGELLANYDVYIPEDAPQPTVTNGQYLQKKSLPVLIDGVWTYEWEILDKSEEDKKTLVKDEASKRILQMCPEWKQRNLTAQAAILAMKGFDNWTPEEQADWTAGEILWGRIADIRAASNVLENTIPVPTDFTDDSHWPVV